MSSGVLTDAQQPCVQCDPGGCYLWEAIAVNAAVIASRERGPRLAGVRRAGQGSPARVQCLAPLDVVVIVFAPHDRKNRREHVRFLRTVMADRPSSLWVSQSPAASWTVTACGLRRTASVSLCRSRSLSRTSALVWPRTLRRVRLPSGPYPSETTPRQLPVHRPGRGGAPCRRRRWSPRSGHGVPPSPRTGLRGNRMAPAWSRRSR